MTAAPGRLWPVVLAVQVGVFLAALEATVVGTATPALIAALGGARLYPWVFAGYMLASTVAMPVFGGLSDRLGRKRPYLFAVSVFAAGALVAGSARSMPVLILGRLLQGTGAGGILSLSLIIFGDLFAGPRRARMQGLITSVWGVASLVGPVLGGVIVDRWSWRWVFFLNVPLGAVVAVLTGWAFRETAPTGGARRLDIPGSVTFVIGATALLLAVLVPGGVGPGEGFRRAVAGLVGLLAFAAFVRIEARAPDPLLSLSLFRERICAVGAIVSFFSAAAMFGALVHVPILVQWGQGTDATTAGLTLVAMSTSWSVGGLLASQVMHRTGFAPLSVGGMALMTAGYLGLALRPDASWRLLLWIGGITGLGMGLVSVTLVVAVQTLVGVERRGMATAGLLFFLNVGATLGVAVMGAVLTARLGIGLADLGAGSGGLPPGLAAQLGTEMGRAWWVGAGAAAVALVATFSLPRRLPADTPIPRRVESLEELIG